MCVGVSVHIAALIKIQLGNKDNAAITLIKMYEIKNQLFKNFNFGILAILKSAYIIVLWHGLQIAGVELLLYSIEYGILNYRVDNPFAASVCWKCHQYCTITHQDTLDINITIDMEWRPFY